MKTTKTKDVHVTRVTKEITWDMAHRLSKHKGQCRNLHGHTYKLLVTFSSNIKNDGMIIDFADIKSMLDGVKRMYDHRTILDGHSGDDLKIAQALKEVGCDYRFMTCEPTAENMAAEIFEYLEDECKKHEDLWVSMVRVYETPTSYAEVEL